LSLIDDLVGNLQRILVYPDRGYQIAQQVPEPALSAYRFLLSRGFDRQLLPTHPPPSHGGGGGVIADGGGKPQ
jgi:hypothetical protein